MLKVMREEDFIVSKTDLNGRIIYCNEIFMEMAEYEESELLGKPHNIIRHPDMPKAIFKYLWENIQRKSEVFAYVLNRGKNKNDYWVYANITATINNRGEIIDYYSVRRKPNEKALKDTIIPLYKKMLDTQKDSSVEASFKVLTDVLKDKGIHYDEFIINIQNS